VWIAGSRRGAHDLIQECAMVNTLQFYIDGSWVDPATPKSLEVINPATEEAFARISMGSKADVDRAVAAARTAFETFAWTTKEDRLALLNKVLDVYKKYYDEIADAICKEMGAPLAFAKKSQAAIGLGHLKQMIKVLKDYQFQQVQGNNLIVREPIGVVGMITPWNWPINQIACKVVPALAAGCTMLLKPSEVAPISGLLWAQVMHEAGVPAGVFNLINGDGACVGEAMSSHPGIDMMSFTGSTRAGVAVAKASADTVKRVAQELGGKSPNVILDDADLQKAVTLGVEHMMENSGQSCNAPSRMFVPRAKQEQAIRIAREVAEKVKPGDPYAQDTTMGPVVSEVQFNKIQKLIEQGIAEGARVVTGGSGRPAGLTRGYFVRPTIFADVRNDMTIAREEIFGPVLSILPYDTEAEAITLANDTVYGLAAYVQSGSLQHARQVASRIRAGSVHLNGADGDMGTPFGGFKQSGTGREWGEFGFEEFLEVKAVIGTETA
jgi:aldehyde dehydrogenase (NAD+)